MLSLQENVVSSPVQTPVLKLKVVPPAGLAVPLGSSRVLECEAGGNPVPTMHWLKNGKRVAQVLEGRALNADPVCDVCVPLFSRLFPSFAQTLEDALRQESEESPQGILGLGFTRSRLFIDCFQPQDEGAYTCVAENAFERLSASTQVEAAQSSLTLLESNDIALCTSKKSSFGTSLSLSPEQTPVIKANPTDNLLLISCPHPRSQDQRPASTCGPRRDWS